jgi:hypothetical protein
MFPTRSNLVGFLGASKVGRFLAPLEPGSRVKLVWLVQMAKVMSWRCQHRVLAALLEPYRRDL